MSLRHIVEALDRRVSQARPSWLAWIDAVPAVRDACRRFQRVFWFCWLPYLGALVFIAYASEYLGLSVAVAYPRSVAPALAGLALLGAIPLCRIGVTALRAVFTSPPHLRFRLRILGFASLVVAAWCALIVAGFIWVALGFPGLSR